jgi:hypothetical protein
MVDDQPHFDAQVVYHEVAKHIPVHFIFGGVQSDT